MPTFSEWIREGKNGGDPHVWKGACKCCEMEHSGVKKMQEKKSAGKKTGRRKGRSLLATANTVEGGQLTPELQRVGTEAAGFDKCANRRIK